MDDALLMLCEGSVPSADEAYAELFPAIVMLVGNATTPERMLGIVQALLRSAIVISNASIATKVDTLLRSESEFSELAAIHWRAGKHMSRVLLQAMREQGREIPPRVAEKVEAIVAGEASDSDIRAAFGVEALIRNMTKGGDA